MIGDISSIFSHQSEKKQNLYNKKSLKQNQPIIPKNQKQNKKVNLPYVPQFVNLKEDKQSLTLKLSQTNISISKLKALHLQQQSMKNMSNTKNSSNTKNTTNTIQLEDYYEPSMEHLKNSTVYEIDQDSVRIKHIDKGSENDDIDSFLEISNKFFPDTSNSFREDQYQTLFDKLDDANIYLPQNKLQFKGVKVNHNINLYGNSSSSINMLKKGFILGKSKSLTNFSFNEINLKVQGSEYLFLVENKNIKIDIQNSVIYAIKDDKIQNHMFQISQTKIKNLEITIKNSVIQSFDFFISFLENVEIKNFKINIESCTLTCMKNFLLIENDKIESLIIDIDNCTLKAINQFMVLDQKNVDKQKITLTKNEISNFDIFLKINHNKSKHQFQSYQNSFFNGKQILKGSKNKGSIIFQENYFVQNYSLLFDLQHCLDVIFSCNRFYKNSAMNLIYVLNTQYQLTNNLFLLNNQDFLISCYWKKLPKIFDIQINKNQFQWNKGRCFQFIKLSKKSIIKISENSFKTNEFPIQIKKFSIKNFQVLNNTFLSKQIDSTLKKKFNSILKKNEVEFYNDINSSQIIDDKEKQEKQIKKEIFEKDQMKNVQLIDQMYSPLRGQTNQFNRGRGNQFVLLLYN